MAFVDEQVGRLLDLLRRWDLYDRALIIVAGDHGEHLGEDGLTSHSYRQDPELVEVPLIVKWPEQTNPARSADLTSVVDLFPTILSAASLPVPPGEGLSLSPGMESALRARTRVLMEEHERPFHPLPGPMRLGRDLYGAQELDTRAIVVDGSLSCFTPPPSGVRTDCGSKRDALMSEVARLQGTQPPGSSLPAPDEEQLRALRALGYLR